MTAPAGRTALFPIGPTAARSYAAGSPERASTAAALTEVRAADYDIANLIGGVEVRTGRQVPVVTPHEHKRQLGHVHWAGAPETQQAIDAALVASRWWGRLPWEERAAPFLRAADLLEYGPWRDRLNAATMLELSKTTYQADIDAACETIDFIRANVKNMLDMYGVQPGSRPGEWNSAEYRPLEGFVFAVTPFNFTCMNNLAFAPAILGNTVVWKPAESASLVAHLSLQLLREAGLPDGVINVVHGAGPEIGSVALVHRDLAAVHFTGSTTTFQHIWRTVGTNVASYRSYPRLVGETGGKDFILAHPTADLDARAVACIRGAYECQGQKCSAASRLYAPRSVWPALKDRLIALTESVVVGDPTEPETVGAVINAKQHAKHAAALSRARGEGIVVGRRKHRRLNGMVRRPDRPRSRRPDIAVPDPRTVRPGTDDLRLRRRGLGAGAPARRRVDPVRPHRCRLRRGRGRRPPGRRRAALHRREPLRQRQAHRLGRRAAALRRRPCVRHQRQGRHGLEPDPHRQPPLDQTQPFAGRLLPLPAPRNLNERPGP
jgi:1-pyrroline-5-carboxylate dehydrogenase